MLSHEDEQRLAAIERGLLIDDPAFVRRLSRHPRHRRSRWQAAAALVVGVLCALATLAGMVAQSGTLTLSGAGLTIAAAWLLRRARRNR
jgi:hypothetical protein